MDTFELHDTDDTILLVATITTTNWIPTTLNGENTITRQDSTIFQSLISQLISSISNSNSLQRDHQVLQTVRIIHKKRLFFTKYVETTPKNGCDFYRVERAIHDPIIKWIWLVRKVKIITMAMHLMKRIEG